MSSENEDAVPGNHRTATIFRNSDFVVQRQVHVVKMLFRPQSQCFQHIDGPRKMKSEGRLKLLFVSVK